jgi:predicted nucleic acid-binding protein
VSVTVDANVLVAAARASDVHHAASADFLRGVERQHELLFCPTLVLAECSAAIARQTDDPFLAERIEALIESFPNLALIALDITLARRAAHLARDYRLRGADSVYLAVAETLDAPLITWDGEILERGPADVPRLTPIEWLEQARTDQP